MSIMKDKPITDAHLQTLIMATFIIFHCLHTYHTYIHAYIQQ